MVVPRTVPLPAGFYPKLVESILPIILSFVALNGNAEPLQEVGELKILSKGPGRLALAPLR